MCWRFLSAVLCLALVVPVGVAAARVSEVDALRAAACGADATRVIATEQVDALCVLYAVRAFRPLWLDAAGQPTPTALRMIDALLGAERRGLASSDGGFEVWPELMSALRAGDSMARAEFEWSLTRASLRLAVAVHRGRIDPRRLDIGIDVSQKRLDLPVIVERLAQADDPSRLLDGLEPPFAAYRRLGRVLGELLRAVQQEDVVVAAPSARVLEPEADDVVVPALRARLLQLGDLAADVATVDASAARHFDPALVVALQRFQSRHGLLVDGRLGAKTLAALNVPLSQRLRQVRLAMERWRWLPTGFAEPPIVVNIPEFRLRAIGDDQRVALDMPVVVGSAFRTRTPVFAEPLRTVVFRPSWTVPLSIVRDELLPRALKDAGYFERQGYEIVGIEDQSLTPETVAGLRRGRLALRQKPGPTNALGRVKFLFPNGHAVYLHDTPSQGGFARARRDLSHGCVRVQDPEALANWVLRKQPEWSAERIRDALDGDVAELAVPVSPPIPVYLVYVTAVARADGSVHYFDDIYGHDAALQTTLDADSRLRCGVMPLRRCARD